MKVILGIKVGFFPLGRITNGIICLKFTIGFNNVVIGGIKLSSFVRMVETKACWRVLRVGGKRLETVMETIRSTNTGHR